jgi:prepilin-type N-terminal cleavage/methylation domain-containing protein
MRLKPQSTFVYSQRAFTMMELMVALTLSLLVIAATMDFFCVTGRALSGTTTQTLLNGEAGYAISKIQNAVRLATYMSNDASGNTLTLAYDLNPLVDSDGDGIPYNDKDQFARFQVQNIGTSSNPTNALMYWSDITQSNQTVLVKSGIRNLPNWNVFTVTNGGTVLIRFGLMDPYATDYYQSIEIQGVAVARNRQSSTNTISILAY